MMRAIICSSLTEATGNSITASRLCGILEQSGFLVELVDANKHDAESFANQVVQSCTQLILAVHAYRSGRLLVNIPGDVKSIIVLGGTDVNEYMMGKDKDEAKLLAISSALKRADKVVAFTDTLERGYRAYCESQCSDWTCSPQSKVVRIPQSVDVSVGRGEGQHNTRDLRATLGLAHDTPLLITIAGLRPVKRPLYLLDSLARLRTEPGLSNLSLVIVGPVLDSDTAEQVALATGAGVLYEQLGQQQDEADAVGTYGGRNGLFYHPSVSRATVLQWLCEADVVVNSSESEGQSNALLEAGALACPRLATACTGNASIITHGETGLLYSSPDEAEGCLRCLLIPGHASGAGSVHGITAGEASAQAARTQADASDSLAEGQGVPQRTLPYRTTLAARLALAGRAHVLYHHSAAHEVRLWQDVLGQVMGQGT